MTSNIVIIQKSDRYTDLQFEKRSNVVPSKKGPGRVHLWVEFSIQNVVLRVFMRKNSKIYPYGVFFSCVFDKIFIKLS